MNELHTLQSLLERLHNFGNKEALLALQQEDIERWTCAEIAETAERLARGLVEAGVEQGEFVPVLAHNRPEWVVAALAVIAAGAAVSPLDSQISTEALERILPDSEARFIFTTTEYLNRLHQIELDHDLRPILLDVEPDDERGWRALLSDADTPLPQVEPDDSAALFYTSGTTGVPKGVRLTHHNLVFQLQSLDEAQVIHKTDRVLLPLPMYHVYPFTVGTLTPLSLGVPIILPHSLTGPQVIRALKEGEVTIIAGVPRVYRAVYDGLQSQIESKGKLVSAAVNKALSASIWLRRHYGWQLGKPLFRPVRSQIGPNLRMLASGGSPLDPELAWKLEGFGWDVAIGYGLTETSPLLTFHLPTTDVPKLSSVGVPLSGIETRIDPKVKSAEEISFQQNGEGPTEGEVLARGESVFTGYRNLPEETKKSFTEDGWFRTGDLGYKDDEGYLYITGRASTMIVLEGGKKVQPDPLEDTYQQNQFIREIGILYQDNQLVALIVPEIEAVNRLRNGDVEQAIREAVNERTQAVASHQRITDYAITERPLPRTNLGKIRRHILEQYYNEAKEGTLSADGQGGPISVHDMSEKDRALLEDQAAQQVWDWLAERYPTKRLTPDTSPQLDLGIDSLEWLSLTLQISEMTGVELDDEAIQRISSVRDLLREVGSASDREDISAGKLEDPESMLTEEQKQWLSPPNPVLQMIGAGLFYLLKLMARLFFNVKAFGVENLPEDENFVLTPNHSSMLDAPAVASVLPYSHMRRTQWAGATDVMLTNPIMRFISRTYQLLPIERYGGGTGMKNLALAATALNRDRNVVWFPEGRISTTGEMLSFRQGIGMILDTHPAPVVPVYIKGTYEALPVDQAIPKPRPVTVTFGAPCDPGQLAEEGEGNTAAARIAHALQQRVAALAEQPHNLQAEEEEPGRNLAPWLALGVVIAFVTGVVGLIIYRRRSK